MDALLALGVLAFATVVGFTIGYTRGDDAGYNRHLKWSNDSRRHEREMMDIVFNNIDAHAPTVDDVVKWEACAKKIREKYNEFHPAPKCTCCGH